MESGFVPDFSCTWNPVYDAVVRASRRTDPLVSELALLSSMAIRPVTAPAVQNAA